MAHEFYQTKDGYILDIERDKNKEAIASLELERMLANARIKAARFYVERINDYASKLKRLGLAFQNLSQEIELLDSQFKTQKEQAAKDLRSYEEKLQKKQKEIYEYSKDSESLIDSYKQQIKTEEKRIEDIKKEKEDMLAHYTEQINRVKMELEHMQERLDKVVNQNKLVRPLEELTEILRHFLEEFKEREKNRTRIKFKDGPEMTVKVGKQFKPSFTISNPDLKVNLEPTNKRIIRECSPNIFRTHQVGYSNIIAIAEDGTKSCILIHVIK